MSNFPVYCRCGRLFSRLVLAGALALSFGAPALADPPPWAPAHGYHKNKAKTGHRHKYHHGDRDRELLPWLSGMAGTGYIAGRRCKREALGAVLGGVVGGVAGAELGKGEHRDAATVAGALIGVLVGRAIGRSLDQADRYCTGQTLEYGQDHQAVEWQDPDARASYRVTPVNTYQSRDGRYCREYRARATIAGESQQSYGTACRQEDGSWEIVEVMPTAGTSRF
jgi:surface antigen